MEVRTQLPAGTKVQFTAAWLARLSPQERRRYAERRGEISGYRMQRTDRVPLPIVTFSKYGRFKEERLFEVPWQHLKLAN